METSQLGLRSSLDLPGNPAKYLLSNNQVIFPEVRWDGVRELFGDERWRQCALPFPLFNPAGTQLGLDPNFFWLPQRQGWLSRMPKSNIYTDNVKAAFFEICLLWIAVAATGVNFYSVNKVIQDC